MIKKPVREYYPRNYYRAIQSFRFIALKGCTRVYLIVPPIKEVTGKSDSSNYFRTCSRRYCSVFPNSFFPNDQILILIHLTPACSQRRIFVWYISSFSWHTPN